MPPLKLTKTYDKYPEYKDSGVDWLGQIPNNWENDRLAHNLQRNDGGVWGEDDPLEEGNLVFRSTEINQDGTWKLDDATTRKLSSSDFKKAKLLEDDLLITKSSGSSEHLGKTAIVTKSIENSEVAFSNFMQRLRADKKYFPKYLFYLLNNETGREQINYWGSTTSGLVNLNSSIIGRFVFSIPPITQQQSIALFLDQKTRILDTVVEKKQKLIDLLSEKRSALITHTVTKGLDPKIKMKPSGIEWVTEIPVNWKVVPLFSKAKENLNKNTKLNNTNLLSLSYGKIIQKDIKSDFGLLPESFNTYQIIKNGYIVLRLTDLQNDHKSLRVGLVNGESGIITSAYTSIFFINGINPTYGYYLLHAYDISKVFYGMGGGVRQSIDYKQVKKLPFILPTSFTEQNSIVDYLESKTELIDSIISKTEKSISELHEFRSSLIYHAVTGKIKI